MGGGPPASAPWVCSSQAFTCSSAGESATALRKERERRAVEALGDQDLGDEVVGQRVIPVDGHCLVELLHGLGRPTEVDQRLSPEDVPVDAVGVVKQPLLAHLGRAGVLPKLDEDPSQSPRRGSRSDRRRGSARTAPPEVSGIVSPMKATTLPLLAWALLGVGCHVGGATVSTLKSTYEEFEQRARWADDAAAAAQLMVPERRAAFLAARTRDATDLSITDIELLDVVVAEDSQKATVISRYRWVPPPLDLGEDRRREERCGSCGANDWFLESMQGGPFPDLAPHEIKSAHRPGAGRDGGRRASPNGTPSPAWD